MHLSPEKRATVEAGYHLVMMQDRDVFVQSDGFVMAQSRPGAKVPMGTARRLQPSKEVWDKLIFEVSVLVRARLHGKDIGAKRVDFIERFSDGFGQFAAKAFDDVHGLSSGDLGRIRDRVAFYAEHTDPPTDTTSAK